MPIKLTKVEEGTDSRGSDRYHVQMVMGAQHVILVDTKFKPVERYMKVDISPETITEANYAEIFENVVEAMHESGKIGEYETATCITYPAGATQIEVPQKGQA